MVPPWLTWLTAIVVVLGIAAIILAVTDVIWGWPPYQMGAG